MEGADSLSTVLDTAQIASSDIGPRIVTIVVVVIAITLALGVIAWMIEQQKNR